MGLKEVGRIPLPAHSANAGFDHAAIYGAGSRLYVAHTANDAVDVVDIRTNRFSHSLRSVKGVAGVWVSEERRLLFTSNRGEDTASIYGLPEERELFRAATGRRPNGIAFDPGRGILLVAGVGDRDRGAPPTATIIEVATGTRLQKIDLPGRTRWALYNAPTDAFYVNIADPPSIAQIDCQNPSGVVRRIEVPASGPHGLEQSPDGRTMFCACDDGRLVEVDVSRGVGRVAAGIAGSPDVVWLNPRSGHLYVAIGEPGVVQVFGTDPVVSIETVTTAPGAHTLTTDPVSEVLHVFLPSTHEDLLLKEDR